MDLAEEKVNEYTCVSFELQYRVHTFGKINVSIRMQIISHPLRFVEMRVLEEWFDFDVHFCTTIDEALRQTLFFVSGLWFRPRFRLGGWTFRELKVYKSA